MKTYFNNSIFYWIITSAISLLLLLNIFTLIASFNPITFLPIIIQSLLLYLIFTKNKNAKLGIKIWSILFLIIANSLQLLGGILQILGKGNPNLGLLDYLKLVILILIGTFILIFTNKTVDVK